MHLRTFSRSVGTRFGCAVGALLPIAGFGQFVETAYLLKLDVFAQTGPAEVEAAGAGIIFGLDFSSPVSEGQSGDLLVSLPTGAVESLSFDPFDRSTASSEIVFDTRAELEAFAPAGTYRFTSTIHPGFTGSLGFPAAAFPPTPRISNFNTLLTLGAVKTTTVQWVPLTGTYQPDDIILIGVIDEFGDEIYASPDPWDPDALKAADGSATLLLPPGRTSIGTVIVMRQTTETTLPGGVRGLAGYGVGTGFPIVSTGPLDHSAPVVTSRVPALGAYAVEPDAPIQLTFDEPMRVQGYLENQTLPSFDPQTTTWSDNRRSVVIDLPAQLPPGPTTFVFGNLIASGMRPFMDLSGNSPEFGTVAASFFVGREPYFNQLPPPFILATAGAGMTIQTEVIWPGSTLKFQWFRDGIPVPGADTASLSDSSFQPDESGLYELEVENEFGTVTSLPVLALADTDPLRPKSVQIVGPGRAIGPGLRVAPGATLELSLDGVFGESPDLQWRHDGKPIPGETGQTLNLSPATADLNGLYDLLATNPHGVAASNAIGILVTSGLSLPAGPAIEESRSVAPGGYLMLWKVDNSSDVLIRKWTLNGEDLPFDPAADWIELFNLQAEQAGTYAFSVSNGTDTVTTVAYEVTLRDPDAPHISGQPGDAFFTEDSAASIGVTVEGKWPFTYQWFKDGIELPGRDESVIAMDPGKPEQAGAYTVKVSNAFGSTESLPAAIRYWPREAAPTKPRILPAPELVVAADSFAFHLDSENDWSPAHPTGYRWERNGQPIAGATDPFLNVFSPSASDAGAYTVVYGNAHGETESDPVTVRVLLAGDPPEIIGPATSVLTTGGEELWLRAPVVVPPGSTLTWLVDGEDRTNEVSPSDEPGRVLLRSVQEWHAGLWSVTVGSGSHSVDVPVARVSLSRPGIPGGGRLSNVSTRAVMGEGSRTLIAGFVVEGPETMRLLIRGIATGMKNYLGERAAGDSRILVFRNDERIQTNENWIRQDGVVALHNAGVTAGAFPLDPWSEDAALIIEAGPGRYTVQALRDHNQPGIGLVEVYSLDPGISPNRLVNLSSRVQVGTEDEQAIPGFVVEGPYPVRVLARAIGPGLDAFNVAEAVRDPQLKIIGANSIAIITNDNWEDQADPLAVAAASERSGAFALDSGSRDAAVLALLPPGVYSVVVASADGTVGVALVELYEIPVD